MRNLSIFMPSCCRFLMCFLFLNGVGNVEHLLAGKLHAITIEQPHRAYTAECSGHSHMSSED